MTIDEAIETVEYARAFNKENTALMRALDVLIGFAEYHKEAEKNEPLTMEQILECGAVYIVQLRPYGKDSEWAIVFPDVRELESAKNIYDISDCGVIFQAYRYPPKEAHDGADT